MIYWRGSITIHRIVIRAFQLRAPYTWINAVEFNKHFSNISLVLTIQLSIMLSSQLLLLATLVASISVITAKDLNWTIQNKPFKVCIKPGTLERKQFFFSSFENFPNDSCVWGEKLTFKWSGPHNVEKVKKKGYENCTGNVSNNI